MEVKYFINNIEVNPPLNDAELSIELNWDKDDNNSQAISLNEFEFGLGNQTIDNDGARLINLHRLGGLDGSSVGVTEGLPFRIELENNGETLELSNGYLDTFRARYDCDRITIGYVEKGNIDWLREVSNSASYTTMYAEMSTFTSADFVSIPYVLSELPNNKEAFMATVSLFLIGETITSQLQSLIEFVAGASLGSAEDIINIILRSIYIIGLLIAAYSLIRQIINLLIQPVKFHDAMTVKRLCEVGAEYYGLTFTSTILNDANLEGMVILPKKYNQTVNEKKDNILGFLKPSQPDSRGFYDGTFGSLLLSLKEMFNAKIIIEGNTIKLEREDYNNSAYNYILPPRDVTDYTLNHEDFKSNYVVKFLTDLNDKNTLQNYEGTLTQATTTPKDITNLDMVLTTGSEDRVIPFARCTRKEGLTIPENAMSKLASVVDFAANQIIALYDAFIARLSLIIKLVNSILKVITFGNITLQDAVDLILNILGEAGIDKILGQDIVLDLDNLPEIKWTDLGEQIKRRRGYLNMENDFVQVQKIGIFDIEATPRDTTVAKDRNEDYINTEHLYNEYHFIRSFVPSDENPKGNQYRKYSVGDVPFTFDSYKQLRTSNYMQNSENEDGRLISARWNIRRLTTDFEYEINRIDNNNLKVTVITKDGK